MGVEKGMEARESRRERNVESWDEDNDTPTRDRWDGGHDDCMEVDEVERLRESSKHRSKERSKSSSRRDDRDHTSKDRERLKTSEGIKERDKEASSIRRKEDRDEREKDKSRERVWEKDADRGKEKDVERGRDKERAKEKSKDKDKERERERERDRERDREKEREKHRDRDREKERENERDRGRDRGRDASEREKGKERGRDKEREDVDLDREKLKERDRGSRKLRGEDRDRGKEDKTKLDIEDAYDYDENIMRGKGSYEDEGEDERRTFKLQQSDYGGPSGLQPPMSELEERISKMMEERLQKKSVGDSEVLSWVNRSRKLEEKRKSEKEKALQLSRIFEEQDNVNQEESDDDMPPKKTAQNLGGVKILHGLDKVLEGGAVVLTLKDQSILVDGDLNQEVDMLENVEIGEQKRRDEAYNAAKKKTGIYDDKFHNEPGSEKKILPQYDETAADEGITLDASGRFSGEAEKKLEELRKRIQGVSTSSYVEDLNSSGRISSDYYTQEEMLKFKKPKKKKSLRKKEKLDLDALEAEAVAAGLGGADLGSRKDRKGQTLREEEERSEAYKKSNAYQTAIAMAEEASKALRQERISSVPTEEDDTHIIGDDDEDLHKSLERARKLSLKKQDEAAASGPRMIAQLASSTAKESTSDNTNSASGEPQEGKLIITEMGEFVCGLQLNEEAQKTKGEDVFMEEDEEPIALDQGNKEENGGWTEIKETEKEHSSLEEEVAPDETIHEAAVGKGLAGALKLLKDRGSLKETVEWGGRNMDKKKSKLVGIYDDDRQKEIRIERTDEYGRILTPKEAFRLLSHKFHGKGPGKMKQEKRMRQYQEELKVKQMKNADTPSQSVERMREVQAQLKTPYLVLSGHVKPGQTSDPRSGFATVEKDLPGGLTPMLGDKKVEHFLGLKRKTETGDAASQKKPKT